MKLGDLLHRLPGVRLTGDPATEVTAITHDSRLVQPGEIFAALPGEHTHGLAFLAQAKANGAAAVLSDRQPDSDPELPVLTSSCPRRHLALAAWALAGDPQRGLLLVGITGTNGKSTTGDLLRAMFLAAGKPAALLGTLGYQLPDGQVSAAERTTPEAATIAELLRRLLDQGGKAVVMEVSSHAIVQERVAGLGFEIAVFTNLTRDHLDFHGDMERYFAAKSRLFTADDLLLPTGRRVLPADEPWGARLLRTPRVGDVSWGLGRGSVCAVDPCSDLDGTSFTLRFGPTEIPIHLPLVGEHNLRNAVAAAAAAFAADLPPAAISSALAAARPLSGRLERIECATPFPVFVDYAHTPEGLRSVLLSLRAITDRQLVVIFGAGGDRDRGKREPMGLAAGENADIAIVTSDNPRTEDPAAIAEAVAAGVRKAGAQPEVVLDRRAAIARGLELADSESLVLVAGKGHEQQQTMGDQVLPFSDQKVIIEIAGASP